MERKKAQNHWAWPVAKAPKASDLTAPLLACPAGHLEAAQPWWLTPVRERRLRRFPLRRQ